MFGAEPRSWTGRAVVATLSTLVAASTSSPALADGPLGQNSEPIRTSRYGIDSAAGPILAGTRVIGLGGAYVAIAEGTDGNLQNPAAPAVRTPWSVDHFDFELGFTLLFPSFLKSADYFNTGRGRTDLRNSNEQEFAFIAGAFNAQLGPWGFGMSADLQRYGLRRADVLSAGIREELVRAQLSVVRAHIARSVDDGQLVGGVGFHVVALDLTTQDEVFTRSGNVFTTRGWAFEGGLLWRPNEEHYRVGLAIRAPVVTQVESDSDEFEGGDVILGAGPDDPNAIWLPHSVRRPWSADLGFALQIGKRPLNPRWVDPHATLAPLESFLARRAAQRARRRSQAPAGAALESELDTQDALDELHLERERRRLHDRLMERYRALSRAYLLIAAAVHADGGVPDSVGVESFLQGYVDRSGEQTTFSPRLGIEAEPIAHWLKLRAGTYLEPSRFRGRIARTHATAGLELKLFPWTVFNLFEPHTEWRVSGSVDLARDYQSWGVSIGVWR
jgi:hypothetical protein